MKAVTTQKFRKAFRRLPQNTKDRARSAYHLWNDNPHHPSLQYKRIHHAELIFSVRIGIGYRALGVLDGDTMVWFWIGSHQDYNEMIRRL
jgi:mRNA-degrading endonuclease RelE of RelBE toxin-antitoxin system